MHRCHVNQANLFNQVIGHFTEIKNLSRGACISHDDRVDDLAFDFNVDPLTARQIRSLVAAKSVAIEAEDFEAAKKIKLAEQRIQTLGIKLAQIEIAKRRAVRDEDYDRAKLLKKEVSSLRKCVNEAVGHCDIDMHVEQQQLMPHLSSKNKVAQDLVRHSLSSEPQPIVVVPEKLEEQKQLGMNNSDSHLGKKSGILKTPQSPQYTGGEEHRDQSSDVFEHIQVRTTPNIPTLPPSTDSMPHFSGALSGLPNVAELPAPEAFAATDIVADADFSAISVFLGEYRACCLMSKNWALREAALAKTRLLVSEGCWGRSEDMAHLCSIARLGIQDKVAQVYLTALALLEDVIQKFSCQDFKSADMLTAMEPALDAIVSKLGDNQARLREKAVDALASPSYCRVIGARQIAAKVMHSLDKKRPPHNKWRPLATRLELLRRLAREYGLNRGVASGNGLHALDLGSVIGFVEIHGCASHTFEEVRTAAKDLIVEMFIAASESDRLQALEPFLHKIRPRQAEEYRNALTRRLQNIVNNEITHESKPRYDVTISPPEASAADSISLKSQAVGHSSQSSVDVSTPPSQNIQEIQQTSTSLIFTFTSHDYLRVQHRLLRSEEEEELFRDQIMKQLEERAFSVQEAYAILKLHFDDAVESPAKENVLRDWVNEVGMDMHDRGKDSRDRTLWEVAMWLFQ